MFRGARRYIIVAAIFLLAVLHFARSRGRDWTDTVIETPQIYRPDAAYPKSQSKPDVKPIPGAPVLEEPSNRFAPAKPEYDSFGSRPLENVNPPSISKAPSKGETKTSSSSSGADSYNNAPDKVPEKGTEGLKNTDSKPSGGSSGQKRPPVNSDASSAGSGSMDLVEEIDHGGSGRIPIKHAEPGAPTTRWKKFPDRFPVSSDEIIKLPKTYATSMRKLQAKFKDETATDKQERLQQLSTIKAEFKHAWEGYKKIAMGHDEVKPLSAAFENPFNGWGATLVDSLDTLWIMDLKEDFSEAVDAIKKIDFMTSAREDIPMFETVIRYLGGLIGAYDISAQRYSVLLEKAEELAEILIGAFDTPNRMPVLYYRWTPASSKAGLAEIGSLSLEFTRLSQLTKEDKYYDAIARITNELEKLQDQTSIPGLWPMKVNAQGCPKYMAQQDDRGQKEEARSEDPLYYVETPTETQNSTTTTVAHKHYAAPTDLNSYLNLVSHRDILDDFSQAEPAHQSSSSSTLDTEAMEGDKCDGGLLMPTAYRDNKYTMGGMADSTYEYLPKEYLLLGGADQYKKMYTKAIDAARKNLLFTPMVKGERDIRFMASTSSLDLTKKTTDIPSTLIYETHHLTCFVGGMVAIGAKAFGIDGDMDLAAKLTDGCVWAYESTTTGIMPERFRLVPCDKGRSCDWDQTRYDEEVKRYGPVHDSAAEAQFRSGESTYGQRVKISSDSKSDATNEGKMAIPLPMPGSLNPHDRDPVPYKRDTFAVGRDTRPSAIPTPTPTGGASDLENRDAPRASQSGLLSQTDGKYQLPAGMVNIPSPDYYLRPEAIESVFIMYRLTGDDIWRRKGWKMFEAISKYTRTELANAAIADVLSSKPVQKDAMESFWLAETLKYFFLLFSDESVVDLDKYVLNTEAHPFLRPT
ncbi:CAZyme family GH47 [Penicillium odoratum]|uniref:CAZyme family GH47 n=1 Tax=Penicillium odoratum TaxID=1167516 RepID=UPI00254893C9|nr:CAZyme family GH47 [Penicillium odoratum]KAJ5777948.1 CAZyme family GH47 [Penicillium odoratum]